MALKNIFHFSFIAMLAASTSGVTLTNESRAEIEIVWAVPTNIWPVNHVWIYKVIPQTFSDAVIANAMAMGSFTTNDEVKLSTEELAMDKNARCFKSKDETRWLSIVPVWGYIEYDNENADARFTSSIKGVPEPVVGVPDLPEATRLGLKYAQLLDVDPSLFARKPHTADLDIHWIVTTRGWTDPKSKRKINEIHNFGVSFTRCIDGFPVSGFGDFEVCFGNHAKVSRLIVSWRNLQPYELHDNLISSEKLLKSIRSGQIHLPRLPGPLMNEIKSVTITNAIPRYNRKPADEPMDFVVPALQLDAVISTATTNISVWFQTGIYDRP